MIKGSLILIICDHRKKRNVPWSRNLDLWWAETLLITTKLFENKFRSIYCSFSCHAPPTVFFSPLYKKIHQHHGDTCRECGRGLSFPGLWVCGNGDGSLCDLLYRCGSPAHYPWSKPSFIKYNNISWIYAHERTYPYIGMCVTHYVAVSETAGCVIRGYRRQRRQWRQQQAVGGCLPICGFIKACEHIFRFLIQIKRLHLKEVTKTLPLIRAVRTGVNVVGEERLGGWEGFYDFLNACSCLMAAGWSVIMKRNLDRMAETLCLINQSAFAHH